MSDKLNYTKQIKQIDKITTIINSNECEDGLVSSNNCNMDLCKWKLIEGTNKGECRKNCEVRSEIDCTIGEYCILENSKCVKK